MGIPQRQGRPNYPSTKADKMKLIHVVTLFVSVSAILSCGNGVSTLDPGTGSNAGAVTASDANNNATTPATNINAAGVNPAHGKPGHRCDIAVGAPLTSSPTTQPSTTVNPVTATTPASTSPTNSLSTPSILPDLNSVPNPAPNLSPSSQPANGLNPAHGQPGHRCDIQVGKPLNSKAPAPTTTTLPSALPNLTSPTSTPAAASTVAPGMNPAHGKPGHRCDIPVGKPLDSKPAQ